MQVQVIQIIAYFSKSGHKIGYIAKSPFEVKTSWVRLSVGESAWLDLSPSPSKDTNKRKRRRQRITVIVAVDCQMQMIQCMLALSATGGTTNYDIKRQCSTQSSLVL